MVPSGGVVKGRVTTVVGQTHVRSMLEKYTKLTVRKSKKIMYIDFSRSILKRGKKSRIF